MVTVLDLLLGRKITTKGGKILQHEAIVCIVLGLKQFA